MNGLNSIVNSGVAHKYCKRFTAEQRLMITDTMKSGEHVVPRSEVKNYKKEFMN